MKTTQAIILCGGKGTRLSTLYSDRPKILVPIAGRPFLEWQLAWLGKAGITDIHLAAGFKAEVLGEWLEARGQKSEVRGQRSVDGGRRSEIRGPKPGIRNPELINHPPSTIPSTFHLPPSTFHLPPSTFHLPPYTFHLSLSSEPLPLGTAGGLKFVEPWVRSDPFLVLNGDSLSPSLDFAALMAAHRGGGAAAPCASRPPPAITIAVARLAEAGRYGTVEFDEAGRVTAFREKAQRESGWINAGVYLIDRSILSSIPPDRNLSLETDVYPDLVRQGLIRACPIAPPMLDMGTPEGIKAMEEHLEKEEG